jgi:hypothetical protein
VPLFTSEEKNLIRIVAADKGYADRLWFYVAVLIAPLAMAIYGIAQRDYLALTVAFLGLLAMVVWSIWREFRHLPLYRSIFAKLTSSGIIDTSSANDA